jgi:hypothetical protein
MSAFGLREVPTEGADEGITFAGDRQLIAFKLVIAASKTWRI